MRNPRALNKRTVQFTANVGSPIFVGDCRNVVFTIVQPAGGTGTIRVRGSKDLDDVNFRLASSITNSWQYLTFVDVSTGTFAEQIDISATTKIIEVNTDGITWVSLSRTFESTIPEAYLTATDNQ